MPHKISFNDAVRLIHSYIYLSPFEPIKNNLPIGGHITLNSIEGRPYYTNDPDDLLVHGTRCWYICGDSPDEKEQHRLLDSECFSVAFESVKVRDTYNPHRGIKSPFLYTCKRESMIYPKPDISVNRFLIEFDDSIATQQELRETDVDVMAINFARKFTCNATSVAYFVNDDNDRCVDEFLANPGIKSFRFFYGYDQHLEKDNIRLILIGVDENSRNIIGENSVILERSWPPRIP